MSDIVQAHVGLVGPTMSGKTYLAKRLAENYLRAGYGVLVLDPLADSWPCSWQTTNRDKFIAKAKASQRCALIVDESGLTMRRSGDPDVEWLFSTSRHWGHRLHALMQFGTQLLPGHRAQITTLFIFRTDLETAKLWAKSFANRAILEAENLGAYEYLEATRLPPACHRRKIRPR